MRRHLLLSLFTYTLCSYSIICWPHSTNLSSPNIDNTINQLYHNLNHQQNLTPVERLNYFSQPWLNQPYILFPLGEGVPNQYDEMPRYRIDGFDCETFVDTVLALTIAEDTPTFKQCMNQIRYKNGNVSFINRNHFTASDWNINNQAQGFLKDITLTIVNQNKQPVALESKTIIDKAEWYKKLPLTRIRIQNISAKEQNKRLKSLRHAGLSFSKQTSIVSYIPLKALFNQQGQPNMTLFKQIPDGAIIEIVRPNWDLTQAIGTHLDISHLGFVFWKHHVLYFRQASIIYNKVVDVPFVEYLSKALKSPTIKGINIQVITIKKPVKGKCVQIK